MEALPLKARKVSKKQKVNKKDLYLDLMAEYPQLTPEVIANMSPEAINEFCSGKSVVTAKSMQEANAILANAARNG